MSLAEILDNGAPHPWANLRINDEQIDGDLTVEGSTTHIGPVIYSGNVDITGNLTVGPGKIITDVIQMTPGADLVILANGPPNVFDVQTSITRANALETNSIDCKTPASVLQIGGANCNGIQVNDDLYPDINNSRLLGGLSNRWATVYTQDLNSTNIISTNANVTNLQADVIVANSTPAISINDDVIISGTLFVGLIDSEAIATDLTIGDVNCNNILLKKPTRLDSDLYLKTTGGTPSALNYYEKGSFAVNMGGCYTPTPRSFNFDFERIGNTVSLSCGQSYFTADATSEMTFTTWPANLRPISSTSCPIFTLNGSSSYGVLNLASNGSGAIYTDVDWEGGASTAKFTIAFPAGLRTTSTTYRIV